MNEFEDEHGHLVDELAARAEQEAEDWRRYADPHLSAEESRKKT